MPKLRLKRTPAEEEEHILAIALKKLNNFFEEKYEGLK